MGTKGAAGEEKTSCVPIINEVGERWLDMIATNGFVILSGSTEGDWVGNYTRIGCDNQESSVIDYSFVSPLARSLVTRIEIGTQDQSNHLPMQITLSECSRSERPKRRGTQHKRMAGHTYQLLLKKTREIRLGNKSRAKWWKTECYKKMCLLRDELSKLRGGTGTVEFYRKAKALYKKEINAAKERLAFKVEEELGRVKTVADGWSFIKRITKSRYTTTTKIPGLSNHLRQLLQGEPQQPTLPSLRIATAPEFNREEFMVTLSQMKERKAEGPDGLKAEALINADHNTKQGIRRQINDILQGGLIPVEWGESTIWAFHKKRRPVRSQQLQRHCHRKRNPQTPCQCCEDQATIIRGGLTHIARCAKRFPEESFDT